MKQGGLNHMAHANLPPSADAIEVFTPDSLREQVRARASVVSVLKKSALADGILAGLDRMGSCESSIQRHGLRPDNDSDVC